jgi:WD40 repeat protein
MVFRHALALGAMAWVFSSAPAPRLVVSAGHAGIPDIAVFAGRYIATASWSNVALIDRTSGLTVARLPQGSLVQSLDAGRSGTLLAVGTCAHAIRIWNVNTQAIMRTIALPQECADSVSFSPDERLIVTDGYACCPAAAVQVWDVASGALVRELARGERNRWVVFGGNARWIGAVDEKGRATVFDWPSGRALRAFTSGDGAMGHAQRAITSRDGRYFGWLGDILHVWDVASGNAALESVSGAPRSDTAAFLEDGRLGFVNDEKVVTLQLPGGVPATQTLPWTVTGSDTHSDMLMRHWFAISADGRQLAGTQDSETVLWEARTGQIRPLQSAVLNHIRSLRWSRGDLMAWSRLGSGLGGWHARRGRPLTSELPSGWLERVDTFGFSPDGTRLAALATGILGSGTVEIREIAGQRTIATRGLPDAHESGVAVGPVGRAVAFASGKDLALFDDALRRLRSLDTLGQYASAEQLVFSPDGRWIAAAMSGPHTFLRVYDAAASGSAVTLDTQDVNYTQPAAFSSDSRWLASVVRDSTLTVWNTGTWNVARAWTLPRTGASLAFAPSGARLAVATETDASVWDAERGRKLLTLATPDGANMREIAWSPDAQRIATAGDDGVLRFWSAGDGRLLASLYVMETTGADWLLVSPDGRIDGTDTALRRLVAWRVGERVVTDDSLTRRSRTRNLWNALR